jgi:hypothetical protein
MTHPLIEEELARHRSAETQVVDPARRAFLSAALAAHVGAELHGDVPAIVATFAPGGHLRFNDKVFDTPESLAAFHHDFGWDGRGALAGITGEITRLHYTYDSVVVEYSVRGTLAIPLGGAPAGRPFTMPMCVVYQFDEAGKLRSERGYGDTGALLAAPVLPV